MMEAVKKLKDWISQSENIVFFGGAGVSTESGIPDFRSRRGFWRGEASELAILLQPLWYL